MSGLNTAEAEVAAGAALAAWGGAAAPPRLVTIRENVVFEARLADGRHVALRLHRPGYQSAEAIAAEMDWTAALARAGQPVPDPVPTAAGGWTAPAGDRLATCVGWIAGAPLGAGGEPLAGDPVALMAGIGRLLAGLHDKTDALALPAAFPRPAWDAAGLLGAAALWGRFWETPATDDAGRALLRAAREAAGARLAAMARQGADYGLIHADVLRENVLAGPRGLCLIDFDDSGWGFRMYDLGTAMVQNLDEPRAGEMAAALLAGYAAARPLPGDAGDLVLFTALRAFASAGWILSRTGPDDPRRASHTDRALRMARCLLDGTAPWDG